MCVRVCMCTIVKIARKMVADVVYVIAYHLKSICQTFPFYAKSPQSSSYSPYLPSYFSHHLLHI